MPIPPSLRMERAVARCIASEAACADADCAGYVDSSSLPQGIAPYWQAWKSEFTPGTPFTLYSHYVNSVTLYVYEENCSRTGVPREAFNVKCRTINDRLAEIAAAVLRLGEKGCVEFNFRGPKKTPLPPNYQKDWRRYRQPLRSNGEILYLMSVDIIPLPKLSFL